MPSANMKRAINIQVWIDLEYDLDISKLTDHEITFLANKLLEFRTLGVTTSEMVPVEQLTLEDIEDGVMDASKQPFPTGD